MKNKAEKFVLYKNSFESLRTVRIFREETKNDYEIQFTPYTEYGMFYSSIRPVSAFLRKYACGIVKDLCKNKNYFILNLPDNEELRTLYVNMLCSSGAFRKSKILIPKIIDENSQTINIKASWLKSKMKELPNLWADRLPIIQEELKLTVNVFYKPVESPKFALFVLPKNKDDNNLFSEQFVNFHGNDDLYYFYIKSVLATTLMLNTGIIAETCYKHAVISIKDALRILPPNFTVKRLLSFKDDFIHIEKKNKTLTFYFNSIYFDAFKVFQRITLPTLLIKHAFSPNNLGYKGLRFLLAIVFGYHGRCKKIQYKPSYLVHLAQISTARGTQNVVNILNRNFKFLNNSKLVTNKLPELTKEDLKKDKAIKFLLNDLDSLSKHLAKLEKEKISKKRNSGVQLKLNLDI